MSQRAILVTGSSRGLGRAIATRFAAAGDRVAVHHRDSRPLAEQLAAGLPGAGRGEPEQPAYAASKAALNAMGQSLAVALAPYGIAVAAVAPGFVETDMTNEHLKAERGEAIRAQ